MTDLNLPQFGMGTAGIGNLYRAVSDDEAFATVRAALSSGIRYFDTAPYYGFGLAERRLGHVLEGLGNQADVIVSTKVGRLLIPTKTIGTRFGFVAGDPFEPVFDYSAEGVLRSFDDSIKRLHRDRIDILLAHDLGIDTHGDEHDRHLRAFLDGGYAQMIHLRDRGYVRAIGVGVNEIAICETLLDQIDLDVILLAGRYTLLDRSAFALLDRCQDRGVKVIIGGPYNSGILATDVATADPADSHYDYRPPMPEIVERVRTMDKICAENGVPLPAAALQFPLRHSSVTSVISGLSSVSEVQSMLARTVMPIPENLWSELGDNGTALSKQDGLAAKLILLHPDDNVLICISPIAAGDVFTVSGGGIRAREGITIGHKVARDALLPGDKVIKYGAPIGSMTAAAAAGQWIHMHNMQSDYIASHTRNTVSERHP